MKGSGKALTRHSSLAAEPSTSTTSRSSCRIRGGPRARSSERDLEGKPMGRVLFLAVQRPF
uniref:Uncharacterized protein n=1 Tax=Neogobius melanostomus TaxID=47308 RepID=A0A8C6SEK3_9GOBI